MNRLSQLRQEKGLNMREAARQLNMPYTTYVNYEKGTREPNSETLIALAKFYGTTIDYLLCKTEVPPADKPIPKGFVPIPEMVQVPLVGRIACGTPILAEQNIKSYVGVPAEWRADFALECHGDSMSPTICDGDVVCIRSQPEVEQGQIAAVRIGEEATLKHCYYKNGVVQLIADNPAVCPPMVYTGPELEDIEVEGLAVGFCRGLV